MQSKYLRLTMIAIAICSSLTACGTGSKTDEQQIYGVTLDNVKPSGSTEEGPKYEQPTLDSLAHQNQQFPSSYALKKYPNGRVVFANVRPDLKPGWKNQVMLKTEDLPFVVSAYYKHDLYKDGWAMVNRFENSAYSSTIWQKDGQEVEVRVSPDPYGKRNVQLFAGPVARPLYAKKAATAKTS